MEEYQAIKEQCMHESIPIISDQTAQFLIQFLNQHQPKTCVEIGSAAGYSSVIIANTLKQRGWHLYTFEVSLPQYKKCIHNLSQYKVWNTTCYHYDIIQFGLKKFVYEKVDFAFVDAQKSNYHNFVDILLPIMNTGSTIICDDCIQYHTKIKPLYTYLEKKQIFYQTKQLDANDWIMIISI